MDLFLKFMHKEYNKEFVIKHIINNVIHRHSRNQL